MKYQQSVILNGNKNKAYVKQTANDTGVSNQMFTLLLFVVILLCKLHCSNAFSNNIPSIQMFKLFVVQIKLYNIIVQVRLYIILK